MPPSYWFNALWVVALSTGLGLASGLLRKRKRMKTLETDASGWRQVLPSKSRREWLCAAVVMFCTSGVPLLLLTYSASASRYLSKGGGVAFATLAIGIAVLEALWIVAAVFAYKSVGDARVAVQQTPLRRDEEVAVRVEIPARGVATTEIVARVVCIEHALLHMGRYTHMAHRLFKEEPLRISAVSTDANWLAGTARVRLPAESCPASGYGKSLNFSYEWQLRVELPGAKARYSVYPLNVA